MKRNLFPLMGIAFVVAIAATGIFYGLFVGKISGATASANAPGNAPAVAVAVRGLERGTVMKAADLKIAPVTVPGSEHGYPTVDELAGQTLVRPLQAGQPITASSLVASASSKGLGIPLGLRAISVHVADSAGLIQFLRSGDRVDVQVVGTAGGADAAVRTLLQNVEVLNVHQEPGSQGPITVVNLLVKAGETDRLALADSAAKVRLTLRNPDDIDEKSRAPLNMGTLLGTAATGTRPAAAAVPATQGPVQLDVRLAAASAATVREFTGRLTASANGNSMRIGVLPADWQASPALALLEKKDLIELLGSDSVEGSNWREVTAQPGKDRDTRSGYALQVRMLPMFSPRGALRLQVRPELSMPARGGISSRRFSADLDVADGQSVLMAGFEQDAATPSLVDKLFRLTRAMPGSDRELLLLVTPHLPAANRAVIR